MPSASRNRLRSGCAGILLCVVPLPGALSLAGQQTGALYAAAKETALIQALASEFTRGKTVVADEWFEEMAAALVKEAGFAFAVKVEVLDDPRPVWYALPGAVYVHTAAILRSRSEADLRMQLAHQLAHSRMRHGWESSGQAASRPMVVWPNLCPQSGAATVIPKALEPRVEQAEREARQLASRWVAPQVSDSGGYARMKERLTHSPQAHRPSPPPTLIRR